VDAFTEIEDEGEALAPFVRSIGQDQLDDAEFAAISARERRSSCRYPVIDASAVLSWWEAIASPPAVVTNPRDDLKLTPAEESVYGRVMARWPGSHGVSSAARATAELARDPLPRVEDSMQSRSSAVRLLDISQTGLMVLSEAVPPAGGRLWLRLEAPEVTDWVEVILKGSTPEVPGVHRVRLAFRDACPYDIFKAVVYKKSGS
jgi:hypothetical protein